MNVKEETMTHREIISWPQELSEILRSEKPKKRQDLLVLAEKVGASRSHWARIGGDNDATESQLVDNIQRAIQTASMINMCKIAANRFWVATIIAAIALTTAIVAWVTALVR